MSSENKGIFSTEIRPLNIYECDASECLSASFAADILQDAGDRQLSDYGFSFEEMEKSGVAFLLSGLSLNFIRRPEKGENIFVKTWAAGTIGAQYLRQGLICSENGESLIEYSSFWILVDFSSHRIILPRNYSEFYNVPLYKDTVLKTEDRIKINIPNELIPIFTFRTEYSDLDMNGHLHNTRYIDIVENVIERLGLSHKYKSIKVSFMGESRLDDEIKISYHYENENLIVFGEHSRGKCFSASVSF